MAVILELLLQVFIYGGVGPLPSDLTVAGVAKAFGVRTVYLVINNILEFASFTYEFWYSTLTDSIVSLIILVFLSYVVSS